MPKKQPILTIIYYSCPSCPVDENTPGVCDTCGRQLERREVVLDKKRKADKR